MVVAMRVGILLTHGAGSNADAPLLRTLDAALTAAGFRVLRYTLPFRQAHAGPPRAGDAARDRVGIREALNGLRAEGAEKVIAGGHSYGGRQASMLLAEEPGAADGLLCLSYPLHPPKKPEQKRTAHLAGIACPALFVHGERDPFGTIGELREALPDSASLVPVPGAAHDLARHDVAPVVIAWLREIL